jgi:hypothetical protein
MRKLLPIICLFLLSMLVFIPLAFTRQSNLRPSDIAINNAIYWAQSFVNRPSFPVSGTDLRIPSSFRCTDFVANAYGYPATSFTAGLIWAASVVQHPRDWNAPRGSLVFFTPNSYNKGMGHVALSLGNGDLIEAGYGVVIKSTILHEDHTAPYLGWAWPPLSWSGRSDFTKATAFTLAVQTGKAVLSTILAWAIFWIIRNTISIAKRHQERRVAVVKANGA